MGRCQPRPQGEASDCRGLRRPARPVKADRGRECWNENQTVVVAPIGRRFCHNASDETTRPGTAAGRREQSGEHFRGGGVRYSGSLVLVPWTACCVVRECWVWRSCVIVGCLSRTCGVRAVSCAARGGLVGARSCCRFGRGMSALGRCSSIRVKRLGSTRRWPKGSQRHSTDRWFLGPTSRRCELMRSELGPSVGCRLGERCRPVLVGGLLSGAVSCAVSWIL